MCVNKLPLNDSSSILSGGGASVLGENGPRANTTVQTNSPVNMLGVNTSAPAASLANMPRANDSAAGAPASNASGINTPAANTPVINMPAPPAVNSPAQIGAASTRIVQKPVSSGGAQQNDFSMTNSVSDKATAANTVNIGNNGASQNMVAASIPPVQVAAPAMGAGVTNSHAQTAGNNVPSNSMGINNSSISPNNAMPSNNTMSLNYSMPQNSNWNTNMGQPYASQSQNAPVKKKSKKWIPWVIVGGVLVTVVIPVTAIILFVLLANLGDYTQKLEAEMEENARQETSEQIAELEGKEIIGVVGGNTSESVEDSADNNRVSSNYTSPELGSSIYDYQIEIDGDVLQFPMYVSDLISLGWEPEVSSYENANTDKLGAGYYESFTFCKGENRANIFVVNFDINEKVAVDCIATGIDFCIYDIKDEKTEIYLPGGISWNNSTYEDVVAAYGTPSTDNAHEEMRYSTYTESTQNDIEFAFDLEKNNSIFSIEIRHFVAPEDFQQSEADLEYVPEYVKAYVTPTKVSDNPEDFIFMLDGDLYKLPCPVSEFEKNGWEVLEEESDTVIEGQGWGRITLRKNNFQFRSSVRNYDVNGVSVSNSFVTDFSTSSMSGSIPLSVFGVEIDDILEDALKVLEPLGFEYTESGKDSVHLDLEYDYDKMYELYFYDDKLSGISINNDLTASEYEEEYGIE